MNDQPHTHQIEYRADLGGLMTYGDQHKYLHLFSDGRPPRWWPRWYLGWKTRRLVRKLIQQHDESSQPAVINPTTKVGAVRSLVAEAQSSLSEREWGSHG